MSSGERPIGAAKGKQIDTEALCQSPPPPRGVASPRHKAKALGSACHRDAICSCASPHRVCPSLWPLAGPGPVHRGHWGPPGLARVRRWSWAFAEPALTVGGPGSWRGGAGAGHWLWGEVWFRRGGGGAGTQKAQRLVYRKWPNSTFKFHFFPL